MPENDFIPNSFQTPNFVIDEVMHLLSGAEFKVYMFAIRHVYGWRNEIKRGYSNMSYSMIRFGYEASTGTQFNGTGLGQKAVAKAIDALTKYRLLIKVETDDMSTKGQAYAIGTSPDIAGLQKRAGIEPKNDNSDYGVMYENDKVVSLGNQQNDKVVSLGNRSQYPKETDSSIKKKHKQTQQTQNNLTPQGDKAVTQDLVWEFILLMVFGIDYQKIGTPNDTIKRAFGRTNLIKRAMTEIHQAHDTQLTLDHLRAFKTWFHDNHDYAMPLSDVKLSELYLKFYHENLKRRAQDTAPAFDSFDYSQLEVDSLE